MFTNKLVPLRSGYLDTQTLTGRCRQRSSPSTFMTVLESQKHPEME